MERFCWPPEFLSSGPDEKALAATAMTDDGDDLEGCGSCCKQVRQQDRATADGDNRRSDPRTIILVAFDVSARRAKSWKNGGNGNKTQKQFEDYDAPLRTQENKAFFVTLRV